MVKRKPQKAPKGSDKTKKVPDIARMFLGKEAAAAADAVTKPTEEKSTKSNPVVARGKTPVKTCLLYTSPSPRD